MSILSGFRLWLPAAFALGGRFRRNGSMDSRIIEIRVVIPPAVIRLFGDLTGSQPGGLLLPGTETLLQISRMDAAIMEARATGDSLGGVVECAAVGLPAGLGAPFFEGVEAVMAAQLFSIPAVKGVEFGAGFGAAALRGSEYNDPYVMSDGRVATARNSAGGLLGGITSGMPIIVRAAFRPTPSISLEQQTVSLSQKAPTSLAVRGRHDPCVAVRAVPVVEGAVALALLELWLERRASFPLATREGL